MKLHLIRHGQAKSMNSSEHDFERQLSEKGSKQINKLGTFLASRLPSSTVLCSEAARTKETLANLCNYVSLSDITYFEDLYLANLDLLLQYLWRHSGDQDLILVGHNFGISDLASYFSGERIEMGTGQYVCIEFNCLSWKETSADTGTIIETYRP